MTIKHIKVNQSNFISKKQVKLELNCLLNNKLLNNILNIKNSLLFRIAIIFLRSDFNLLGQSIQTGFTDFLEHFSYVVLH